MDVERKVLRSVSELSMFKYLLVFYLIFFILSVILMGILGLIVWLGFSSFGVDINSVLEGFGLGNLSSYNFSLLGGGVITIIMLIASGLFASVFYAAVGTLAVWIMNVVLRIIGGVELRFLMKKEKEISPEGSK
jgi:nitrate reductase NapE component